MKRKRSMVHIDGRFFWLHIHIGPFWLGMQGNVWPTIRDAYFEMESSWRREPLFWCEWNARCPV